MGISVVKDHEFGVYLWQMPNGGLVADEEGAYLSIASAENDIKRIQQITDVARSYGLDEGVPIFFPGRRKISQEEYQIQRARMELGLIPDEYDVGAWADAEREQRDKQ